MLATGVVGVGFPIWRVASADGDAMFNDTRAFFGAGTMEGAPRAASVSCTASRSGSGSSRGVGITEYNCVIDLTSSPDPQGEIQVRGRSHDDIFREWQQRRDARFGRPGDASAASNRLERRLALNYSGELPTVRVLSSDGEPRRIGLVWGAGEMFSRWLQWLLISALFLAFGAAGFYAGVKAWTKKDW